MLESAVKPGQSEFSISQSSEFVVHMQTTCAMHKWYYGTTLLHFFSTISLPGFCRKKYSSSGLEKDPKEKDLIWTLTTILAVIRNKFLNLPPNSCNANIHGHRSARSSSLDIPCWHHASELLVWWLQKISSGNLFGRGRGCWAAGYEQKEKVTKFYFH